ncbi:Hypothetical protein HVR_LOCUS150 [uncultured virus]|nr:Hypothetical protein HVR_LOCUS150 [uncultured virus]
MASYAFRSGNFDIKIEAYSCQRLGRTFGCRRHGTITVSELIREFNGFAIIDDTVGSHTGNIYLPNVRSSKSIPGLRLKGVNKLFSIEEFRSLCPDGCDTENFEDSFSCLLTTTEFKLHCYELGGFFAKHTDGKKGPRHFATLLIFPPASISTFEGGDLILYPENEDSVTIKTSEFQDWTAIAFLLNVPHECTPVTSGKRFVFKAELDLPHDNLFFSNTEPTAKSIERDISVDYCDAKISALEAKIIKCETKKHAILNGQPTTKVQNFLDSVEETPGNVCVVLATSSPSTDPNTLKGEEALFWNKVVERWPYSSLQIKETAHRKGDGSGASDELQFGPDYEEEGCEIGNAKILYWKSPKNNDLGRKRDTRSEYNDNTYDYYNDITVALVCIQKESYQP